MEEIQEMSALIDNALGIQTSHSPNHILQQHVRSTATQDISPASPYSPTKLTDMLCIKVIQLHSLPNGMPKNLQLYLSFNWDGLGRASTHALRPPKHVYNATLRFRSPLPHGSSLQDALMNSPPLMIELLARNENGHPDLCLGRKFIEDPSLFDLRKQPLQIKLDDGNNGMVGIVEIEIVIM